LGPKVDREELAGVRVLGRPGQNRRLHAIGVIPFALLGQSLLLQ